MKTQAVLHDASFAQVAARRLLALGNAPSDVFGGTGFGQVLLDQQKPLATTARIAGFFDHAEKLSGDDLFGVHLAQSCDLRQAGLLGYICRSTSTPNEFLQDLAQYAPLLSDSWDLDTCALENEGQLDWSCKAGAAHRARQYSEFLAVLFLRGLFRASDGCVLPKQVEFSHQRCDGVVEMEAALGCPIRFGSSASCAVFGLDDLYLPLVGGDPVLLRLLTDYGDLLLGQHAPSGKSLVAQVEEAISARLPAGPVSLAVIAADLGMSSRTLSRKLSQSGTSYFSVLENMREMLARRYLTESQLSLGEVAFLLGYSGLSSFSDAFRRWTGQSPGNFRAEKTS